MAVAARRAHDAEQIVARLRPYAAQVRLGPPVDGCFVNASFLVATDTMADFERAVSQLRDEASAYAYLQVFGPLPPYSFVDPGGTSA